jgi:hypothetical protein
LHCATTAVKRGGLTIPDREMGSFSNGAAPRQSVYQLDPSEGAL